MELDVRDQLYVIVGGTRGMGYEASRALAKDGARLAIFGRTASRAEEAADEIRIDFHVEVRGYAADASARDGRFETLLAEVVERRGAPRGLLVTTGVRYDVGTFLDKSDAQWDAVFQDVLMGHVRAARSVIPLMIEAGGGQNVTTAAYSARVPNSFMFDIAIRRLPSSTSPRTLRKPMAPIAFG
jgi:NAD(P)-dependent dehydrogenase (short-subunit alcohol dehydrogenase family)